ncbi:MAG TPA: LLM class flavin-dependent oxidoreductase [Candidatus Binatus sp.]|uniref:LLM class flavin-dependent oxidoreductase n=1 Tax=Candidatus Binatus sp. TaxID=2811406 RepID=UPI002F42AE69
MSTKCGISIPQTFEQSEIDLELIRKFVIRAEALGYDSLWVQEQMISDAAILEPVALLTYVAALTSRVRLGTAVLLTAIRNPVELAKTLATVDQLSRGRLIVGVGIGGPTTPHEIFAVPRDQRGHRFVEGLKVMKALWTQPKASVSGDFWNFTDVPMEPKPAQKPHPPIWFGARTELGLKRAARLGNGWMGPGSSSSAEFVQHMELIRRLLDEAKRDPATFSISKRVYIAVDDNRARAEQRLRRWFGARYKFPDMAPRVSIFGSRAECVDKLGELIRAGAQQILLDPVFDHVEQMELLAAEVVPAI